MRHTMTNRMFAAACAVLLIVLLAGPVLAGPRDHEDGFFMRLSAGGAAASTKLEQGGDKLELTGAAGDLNLAFGGIVSPNLALHGTLFGWSANDPDRKINGVKDTFPGTVTAAGLGVGLTYYVMPADVYFSGTIGSGRLNVDVDNGGSGNSDRGVMLDITVGKEWWVGDNWGLGVALGMTYHSFPDPDIDLNWTGTSFGIRFSATMN